jgi:hypothetical protein
MGKIKKVNKTMIGMNGETLHITGESRGKAIPMREAIKLGLVVLDDKKAMQKMFSEDELKEMGYDYTETEE